MKVEYRSAEALIPYSRNSRTHSDEQIAQIMASMLQFGWTNPMLADADGIVAGHGRVMAAIRLYASGHTLRLMGGESIPSGMVPVIDCTGWTAAQRKAYIIADNRLAENAGWDSAMLALDIGDLRESGFDVSLTGFSDADLDSLLAGKGNAGQTDPDNAPEVQPDPISRMGDLWLLGKHRLLCGDSTRAEDVARLCGGGRRS